MNDVIIKKLINNIKESNKNKSSYWARHLDESSDFLDINKNFNFGSYTKKSFKNIGHNFLSRIIHGNKIYTYDVYKKYKIIFDKIDRFIDIDTSRHIFIFEKIKKFLNPKKICIIGDGKINGVLGAHLTFPKAKIFSVNLSETLISDYLILKKIDLDLKDSITLVEDINFTASDKILHLIPSNLKNFLLDKKIDLFINVASFQEMTAREINNYFNIIKNNRSNLYCCNREYKKIYGGEELYFDKYPWNNCQKIFWENCSWHKKYYTLRPPFIHNYDGNVKHCLVDFSI